MGLLKALFKRKVAASGIGGGKEGPEGAETTISTFNKLSLDERPGQGATRPLPFQSDATSWGDPEARPGIVGQNPLESMLDISVRSHETVDYTHDDDEACDVNQQGEDGHSSHPNGSTTSLSVGDSSVAPSPEPDTDGSITSLSISDDPAASESAAGEDNNGGEEDLRLPPPPGHSTGDLTAEALVPLQSMVYLTEDGENMADTMSVVSDSFHEGELSTELSHLGRALETLENQGGALVVNSAGTETSPAAAAAAAVVMQAAGGPPSLLLPPLEAAFPTLR